MLLTGAHLCHKGQQQLPMNLWHQLAQQKVAMRTTTHFKTRSISLVHWVSLNCALGPIFCITGLGSSSLPIALVTIVTSTIYVINAKSKVKKNWKARSEWRLQVVTPLQYRLPSGLQDETMFGLITRPELPVIQFWDFYSPTSQHSKFYNRTYFFFITI